MITGADTGQVAVFAAVFAGLFAAHQVADHWIQTEHQATTKGTPGWAGRRACLAHVASYTAVAAVMLAAIDWRCHAHLPLVRTAAGLAVSALTHYVADRRAPLRWLAEHTTSARFWHLGAPRPGHDDNVALDGAYLLDQSWHYGWLAVAALVIA